MCVVCVCVCCKSLTTFDNKVGHGISIERCMYVYVYIAIMRAIWIAADGVKNYTMRRRRTTATESHWWLSRNTDDDGDGQLVRPPLVSVRLTRPCR